MVFSQGITGSKPVCSHDLRQSGIRRSAPAGRGLSGSVPALILSFISEDERSGLSVSPALEEQEHPVLQYLLEIGLTVVPGHCCVAAAGSGPHRARIPGMDDRLDHDVPDHSYQPAEAGSWNTPLRAAGEHAFCLQ